jgi:hypothetical protein
VKERKTLSGGCHCGAVRFELADEAAFATVCHCTDCRRHSGAPIVAWAMAPASAVAVTGKVEVYRSSETGERSFCSACGTGLFFANTSLRRMGMMQVRIAALDDPDSVRPQAQVQTAERIIWMASAHELPAFERFPD